MKKKKYFNLVILKTKLFDIFIMSVLYFVPYDFSILKSYQPIWLNTNT